MTAYWCELAWLGDASPEPGVLIEIDGERISSLQTGCAQPPSGVTRLAGLTLPGLANAHSHAFQRALRGRTQAQRGSFWTWREAMYELAGRLDPEGYYALARATFAEMALAGITLVGEFHYLHHAPDGTPYADPNAMGHAVREAAREAGVRITLLDACYLHGGIDTAPREGQRRFCDPDVEAWALRVTQLSDTPMSRVGAAIHSLRAVDPDSAATVAAWTAERDVALHAHVSEQQVENDACLAAYGRTPTALLAAAGALSEHFTAIHATHVSDDDAAALGRARAVCCLCPTTERDLADGVAPASRLRDAGSRLALGSDSQAVIDPFEEMRAVELDERLTGGVRGQHTPAALLGAGTTGGYASLGWPEGGRLQTGALADLVTVALDSVRLAGTAPEHALGAAVFAAGAPDVREVIVGGATVVHEGVHLAVDAARELETIVGALVA